MNSIEDLYRPWHMFFANNQASNPNISKYDLAFEFAKDIATGAGYTTITPKMQMLIIEAFTDIIKYNYKGEQ